MCSIQTRREIEQASMALKFWARGTERMEFSRHRKDYGEKHTLSPISFQILPLPHFLYFLLLDSSGEKKCQTLFSLSFILILYLSLFSLHIAFSYTHFPACWFFLQLCLICYQAIFILLIMLFGSKISIGSFSNILHHHLAF